MPIDLLIYADWLHRQGRITEAYAMLRLCDWQWPSDFDGKCNELANTMDTAMFIVGGILLEPIEKLIDRLVEL